MQQLGINQRETTWRQKTAPSAALGGRRKTAFHLSLRGAPCSRQDKGMNPTAQRATGGKHRTWITALEKTAIASNLGAQFRGLVPPHSPQELWESRNNYSCSESKSAGKGAREGLPKITVPKLQKKWLRKQSQGSNIQPCVWVPNRAVSVDFKLQSFSWKGKDPTTSSFWYNYTSTCHILYPAVIASRWAMPRAAYVLPSLPICFLSGELI